MKTPADWHALFSGLTDLTRDTDNWSDVAQRWRERNPELQGDSDLLNALYAMDNTLQAFHEPLAEMFFIPEEHGWSEEGIAQYRKSNGGIN